MLHTTSPYKKRIIKYVLGIGRIYVDVYIYWNLMFI